MLCFINSDSEIISNSGTNFFLFFSCTDYSFHLLKKRFGSFIFYLFEFRADISRFYLIYLFSKTLSSNFDFNLN